MRTRTAALAILGLTAAAWLAGSLAWATDSGSPWEDQVGWILLALAIMATAVALLVLLGVVVVRAALMWRGRVGRVRPGVVALALAVAAGLLAATPVRAGWHDGCNDHVALLPLIAAPYTRLAKPENPRVHYGDFHTDMFCASPGPQRGS